MKELPTLSADLIRELTKDESDLNIHFGMDIKEVMYKAGRWSVLNELLHRLDYFDNIKPNKTETIL